MEERFLAFVDKKEGGCWEWNGTLRRGYGRFRIGKYLYEAHRVSYELYNGEIPTGLMVRHKCNNRCCVNPDHLETGSHLDNMKDMRDAERQNKLKGEKHNMARLTEAQVLDIRSSELSGVALAKIYNVAPTTISMIKRGSTWKHIL